MKEYDEITLKKVQSIELELLKDFIYLCKKYNFTYFGFAGTGIGALRHKGFIPWDDDIDVGLPRKDYDRFIQVAQEEFSDKYTILNTETDENYPLMTTRWIKKGTEFREEAFKNICCDLGIFLDIYAFDNISDNEKEMKKQVSTAWFWSKVLILRSIPFPVLQFKGIKGKIIHLICAILHYTMVVFRIPKRWIYRQCKKACCRYYDRETKKVSYFCGVSTTANCIEKKNLINMKELPFEDTFLPFPNNIHEMLEALYGDYMQLPPKEKRINHYPYSLKFGDEK